MLELRLGIILILINCMGAYVFNEELLVENLPNAHVHLQFQFTSIWDNKNVNTSVKNYDLFPKRLADIAHQFDIEELKLTLTQGTWKHDQWGTPGLSAPSGGELWSVFNNRLTKKLVDEYWLQSSRTISGLFGLSINLIDNPNTVLPRYLDIVSENTSQIDLNNLRYASVPNEIVCTENLTPWLKLLPCGKYKGLGTLFKNLPKLFESQYFLIGLNFKQKCLDSKCLVYKTEMKHTLSMVYNLDMIKTRRTENEIVWSFNDLFANKIDSLCPVATATNVYMDLGAEINPTKPSSKVLKYSKEKTIHIYDLKSILQQEISFNPMIITKRKASAMSNQLISIHRYITNSNERNFGLKTMIKNQHSKKISIVYFDTIPWYFRTYVNSLRITQNDGIDIKPVSMHFMPSLDRKRPNHLELVLELEPDCVYSIYYQVEYAYLKWDEYPPDVNHGFFINPAIVSIRMPKKEVVGDQIRLHNLYSDLNDALMFNEAKNVEMKIINVYTEKLIMNLPVPDFSMPYNVICLTCTVIAIAFGSIHNFTTRRFHFAEKKDLKQKMTGILAKIFSKLFKKKST